jgi:hypothetical protein
VPLPSVTATRTKVRAVRVVGGERGVWAVPPRVVGAAAALQTRPPTAGGANAHTRAARALTRTPGRRHRAAPHEQRLHAAPLPPSPPHPPPSPHNALQTRTRTATASRTKTKVRRARAVAGRAPLVVAPESVPPRPPSTHYAPSSPAHPFTPPRLPTSSDPRLPIPIDEDAHDGTSRRAPGVAPVCPRPSARAYPAPPPPAPSLLAFDRVD